MRLGTLVLAAALLLPAASRSVAAGGDRFVLAWPPTRYASAELVLWRDVPDAVPLRVRVSGRGFDRVVDLPPAQSVRVPLPAEARCAPGLDACAIEAVRVEGAGTFSVLLQSPDTNGAADTLLLTAHDTVLIPPAAVAVTRHVALSMPCAPPSEMPMTASFVTVVPVSGPAHVTAPATSCAGAVDATLAAGEALTLSCGAEGDDLSGLALDSDAPVVALSGNAVTTVPVDPGRGLSGDLVMDLAATDDGPARFAVPPLPRDAAHAGLGDIVRLVAVSDANVTIRDDRGGVRVVALAAGESLDLDTAAPGAELELSLDADAAIAAWHVPKSRALRGMGDSAAIPLVPSSRFATGARFFVPDGYGEANVLCITAEPGATVTLDGTAIALHAAPGGSLLTATVALPAAPPGGAMHELSGDAPFGAWVAGFGGYKAYGHAAAIAWPDPAPWLLRGTQPDDLQPLVRPAGRAFADPDPSPVLFWRLEDPAALLRVTRCGGACCLGW